MGTRQDSWARRMSSVVTASLSPKTTPGQPTGTIAGTACHSKRYKRYSRYTGALRPVAAGGVGNRQEGLPDVRVPVPMPVGTGHPAP